MPFNFEWCPAISEIPPTVWNGLVNCDHPFLAHSYLLALETSGSVGKGTGWQPLHLIMRDNDRIVGLMPFYVKSHSYGEYVFDQAWARAYEAAGGHYYPKLLSAIPFTPVTGPRLLATDDQQNQAMCAALKAFCHEQNLSSCHVLFPPKSNYETLESAGFLGRIDFQFWWHNKSYQNFDDFLANLSANRRKVIKRERRDVHKSILPETLVGSEITEMHLDCLYGFIEDTYARKWGQPYLNRTFFSEIDRTSMVLILAKDRQSDDIVAASVHFRSNDALYGRQWGCSVEIPFLHFELCYYQAIEFAIENGIHKIEAGTQGYHKLTRGYDPHPVYSAHYFTDPRLKIAVSDFLQQERTQQLVEVEILKTNHSAYKQLP
jgi:predicted N-acyltransferase